MAARALILAVFLVSFCQEGLSNQAILIDLEKKLNSISSFSADFTQTYNIEAMDTLFIEKGKIYILKPDKLRWEYLSPEEKLFVCDGENVYFYVPEDKQVIVDSMENLFARSAAMAVFMGRMSLSGNFNCEIVDEKDNQLILRFNPIAGDSSLQRFILNVSLPDLLVIRIAYIDEAGNLNEIKFTDIRINKELKEKMFIFDVPRDAEVMNGDMLK